MYLESLKATKIELSNRKSYVEISSLVSEVNSVSDLMN